MKTLTIGRISYDINMLVDNFPTEGATINTTETIKYSGGPAAIVSTVLAKWNNESYISGVVGYDEMGNSIRKELESKKVLLNYLETNYDNPTNASYIINNKQNNIKTVINTISNDVNIKKYEYDLDMNCVVTDGSEYNASLYALNKYANKITVLNACNPYRNLLDLFKYAKIIICTSKIAEEITGIKIDVNVPTTLSNTYIKISEKYPNAKLLIHVDGMGTIYQINGEIKVLSDIKTNDGTSTGSYEVFVSCLSHSLASNYDLEIAIRLATIASSLTKNEIGNAIVVPILSDIISYYENKFGKLQAINNEVKENNNNENAPIS